MSPQKRTVYWLIAFALFLLIVWTLSPILSPFVFGALIAYFLDPIADRFERFGFSRVLATALVTGIAVIIFSTLLLMVVPPLIEEIDGMLRSLPGLFQDLRSWIGVKLPLGGASGGETEAAKGVGEDIRNAAKQLGLGTLKGIWTGGSMLIDTLSVLALSPIIAFYLLLDWDRMIARIDRWLPRNHAEDVRMVARDIDSVMSGFLRGQLTVCLILGMYYAIALSIVGLKFGLVVGIFSGIICFIPFLGSFVGLVLSVGIALSQFWGDWAMIGIVAAIFISGQLVEGNILTPKLVGGSVGLHPVWLIFALSAFGYLFGFAGLVLAVPVAAVIGVVTRWGLERYLESALYHGDDPPQKRDEDLSESVEAS